MNAVLEKKTHELEHQLQVKETVIKNLTSTNEHLTLEITNLRQRSNLKQPETKKVTTTSAFATTNAESSNSQKKICFCNHRSQRSYGFLITKEMIFGFQILDLKDHFSASLIKVVVRMFLNI